MAKLRVAKSGMATVSEIDEKWSLIDLADAMEYLDILDEADDFYAKQLESKTKKGV
jgi:hypothetical protein